MNTVITSFNERGYNIYAKEFLHTWRNKGPRDCKLVVYYEGNQLERFAKEWDMAEWRDILEVDGLENFMGAVTTFPVLCGHLPNGKYEINYDARMGRKTYMQCHAVKQFGGKVFWIDADVMFHSTVPDGFLDSTLPDDKLNCFLGRDGWFYTESGFIGFNAAHPVCERFMYAYRMHFDSGLIFTMKRWHDCQAFDSTREALHDPEPFVNLSAGLPERTLHPFVNTVLGAYADHRKGPRKRSRSTAKDLVVERDEPYWNEQEETASDA